MTASIFSAAFGLAQFAPVIAKWLGGEKAESIAKDVLGIARQITGEDDPVNMIQALKNNPELLIAFQQAVLNMESEAEMAYLRDRQDARFRDATFLNSGVRNIRADVMVVCAAGGLISCLASLVYFSGDLPGEAVGIISTVAGIFGACLKDAYAFEFGSSRGSKLKDSAVVAMLDCY